MPAQEVDQPQAQLMDIPTTQAAQQPKPAEQMTAEPVSMRGGGEGGDICCGICAGIACFECLACCC